MPQLHHSTLNTEALFRLLIESVKDYAIFVLDPDGCILTWNPGAQRIKGYSAEEIIGQHFSRFYPKEAIERRWPWQELELAVQQGRFEDEGWRLRKDGSRFWANVIITPLYHEGELVGFAKVTRDLSEQGRVLALEVAQRASEELLRLEREARAQAERTGRMKDEFLTTLSHELRSPLNAILGWTQVLLRRPGLPAEFASGLAAIERNAHAQTQLVSDLLDMSTILSGQIRLNVQRVDLPQVVRAVVESFRPAAAAKQVRLEVIVDPAAGPVSGDPDRLQQVAWNLLSNAIKFTPKGGKVQVVLQRIRSHLALTVTDTGIGMSQDFLPYLFDRFSQADGSIRRGFGGLGLGLSLVKQLVELHGGAVMATSEGQGRGATFTVELPVALAHSAQPHPEPSPASQSADALDLSALPDLSGLTVLVVDDEEEARGLIHEVLRLRGATVLVADSAQTALRLLETHAPDVLVSDLGMPGMDGLDLMRRLRRQGNAIPAAALTAYARAEDRRASLLAGYQIHLSKPVDVAELVITVASLSGRTQS